MWLLALHPVEVCVGIHWYSEKTIITAVPSLCLLNRRAGIGAKQSLGSKTVFLVKFQFSFSS